MGRGAVEGSRGRWAAVESPPASSAMSGPARMETKAADRLEPSAGPMKESARTMQSESVPVCHVAMLPGLRRSRAIDARPIARPTASGRSSVMVQDFETSSSAPSVWVVNIPDDHASVRVSAENPHDGKPVPEAALPIPPNAGPFQYLGIPNKTKIQAPCTGCISGSAGIGSNCSYGVQITDVRGETHQYSKNTGQGGIIDFRGWKEIVFDLDGRHETWGGDKNGKLDYPITGITFTVGQPSENGNSCRSKANCSSIR